MGNLRSSRVSALIASLPGGGGVERDRRSAPAYLSGHKGILLLAAALGIIGLLAGWRWFGAGAVLPLLYVLPCAAMMAMCMKGHGGTGNTQDKPGASNGTESSGSP